MTYPKYTWETCKNVTAAPQIPPELWTYIMRMVKENGNNEFGPNFLPPSFCDPENYVPPDRGHQLMAAMIASIVLTVLVVLARFGTRIFVAGRIGWDDWTIILATLFLVAEGGTGIHGVSSGGIGKHVYDIDPSQIILALKVMFTHSQLYTMNVFLVKASLLFFYKRLFPPGWRKMQIFLNVFILFLFVYAIASCLTFALHCNPVRAFWTVELRLDHCPPVRHSVKVYTGIRVIGVIADILVLLLPMKYVWDLQLPIKQRLGLACIFGMGGFAVAAAIMRLVYYPELLLTIDAPWRFSILVFAAQLEHTLAIVTACVPALTALRRTKALKRKSNSTSTSIKTQKAGGIIHYPPELCSQSSLDFIELGHNQQAADGGVDHHNHRLDFAELSKTESGHYEPKHVDSHGMSLRHLDSSAQLLEPEDYLTWAYYPERVRQNGNFANAYGTYTCPQQRSRFFMTLRRHICGKNPQGSMGALGIGGGGGGGEGGAVAGGSREAGVGARMEQPPNVLRKAQSTQGLIRSASAMSYNIYSDGHGHVRAGSNAVNQIVMTSEVEVRISSSRPMDLSQERKESSRHGHRMDTSFEHGRAPSRARLRD